jgi:translation initiation factor IF-2
LSSYTPTPAAPQQPQQPQGTPLPQPTGHIQAPAYQAPPIQPITQAGIPEAPFAAPAPQGAPPAPPPAQPPAFAPAPPGAVYPPQQPNPGIHSNPPHGVPVSAPVGPAPGAPPPSLGNEVPYPGQSGPIPNPG